MATNVSRGRIFWRHSKHDRQNSLLGASFSAIFPTQAELYPISPQISLPWQPGSVVVEFLWHHSIALPRKPHVGCKDLLDISYTSRVIANFVSNLVAMATWVDPFRIFLTSLDSLIPKSPAKRTNLGDISYTNRVVADLFSISLPWQRLYVALQFAGVIQ